MSILIKSATLIDPGNTSLHLKKRDVLVKKGTIEKIAAKISVGRNTQIIERHNLHLSVGWFDSSVAFGEPGFEERETITNGLEVAAKSGFTDILLNTNTSPTPDTSSDIVFLKERGNGKVTNLYPLGNLTQAGKGEHLAELYDMHNAGAVGFYDYKKSIADANLMKIALLYAQNFGGLVCSFPQDTSIAAHGNVHEGEVSTRLGLKGVPALAEELQIARDLFLLEYTGGKLHIPTVSSIGSIKLIAEAKKKGLDVTCSVPIHNLFFTDKELETFDTNFKTKPPIRQKQDAQALLKGLKNGTIDFVTSDHTPIDIEEKRVEFDNADFGTIGLESAFGGLNALLDTEETVKLLTKGRERFHVKTPKLKEGEPANLTLFDPDEEYVFSTGHIGSTSKNSIFLNKKIKGLVYGSINNGKMVLN
ncbi:dihydroorotase [Allomuricauda sp. SCSIO 65647]|uniref:dihydroorotase n=1 Tax=Allomuricauda sp. SCSIO 65647 TaxID=2908843 RepID=UPI001F3CBACE|nr:dihydroorotase [Muricauda sp. SCSIO 65647]UJH67174.1 dihydroorotase [Muricauda sp. SCSIO 65647]